MGIYILCLSQWIDVCNLSTEDRNDCFLEAGWHQILITSGSGLYTSIMFWDVDTCMLVGKERNCSGMGSGHIHPASVRLAGLWRNVGYFCAFLSLSLCLYSFGQQCRTVHLEFGVKLCVWQRSMQSVEEGRRVTIKKHVDVWNGVCSLFSPWMPLWNVDP